MIDIEINIYPCYEVSGPGIDGRFGIVGSDGYEGNVVITNPSASREEMQYLKLEASSSIAPDNVIKNLIAILKSIRNDIDQKISEIQEQQK